MDSYLVTSAGRTPKATAETSPVGIILMQNRRRARAIAIAKTEAAADIKLRLAIITASAIVALLTISHLL